MIIPAGRTAVTREEIEFNQSSSPLTITGKSGKQGCKFSGNLILGGNFLKFPHISVNISAP